MPRQIQSLVIVLLLMSAAPLFAGQGDETAWLGKWLADTMTPWMWGVAALCWTLVVLLAGRMIERGLARRLAADGTTWLRRAFRLLCYVICALIALLLLLQAVGAAFVAAPLLQVEKKLLLLAAAIGIADLALLLVNLAIDRYLDKRDGDGQPIARSPRVLTLLPLLRNIAMITLGSVLALVVLGEFGVNTAPLLAGAGVVGVAVGFGAQKLVQDVITGAFMLFENTIAVGDSVKIGDHAGIVEGMSLRTLRLRDSAGALHTMPFSAVGTVINLSRDFGYHSFELNLSYESDVELALATILQVGAEMQTDPALAADILAPLELFGVERLGEWAIVLSGRIKTPPARQAVIARAFNRRIKDAFAAADLKLALPARILHLSAPPVDGTPP